MSEVPGTTRDTIDTIIERGERTFQLIDTAGLRRKRSQRQGIEYYSELRALDAAKRADVALVLIDASQGIVEGDITAVEVARKAHCATLIVLAKWDICEITIEEVRPELQRRLRQRPDFITVSSVSGRGVTRLLDKVAELYDRYVQRISTGELNRLLAELKAERQPPSKGQPPPQPALRRTGPDAAAALPVHRQRPGARDARLRLLGREPAPRAARPRRGAGGRRLSRAVVGDARGRRRRGGVGDRSRAPAPRAWARRLRRAARHARRRAVRRGGPVVARGAEPRVPRGARARRAATRRSCRSRKASTRRPASGSRRSSRTVRSRCSPARTWRRR